MSALVELNPPVILDARSGPDAQAAFAEAHFPGARWVDLEIELSAPTRNPAVGGRHPLPPLPAWCARIGTLGIAPDVDVVVYDALGGGNAAARAWWMLRAVGHARVQVVDGGWDAIVEAGVPLTGDRAPGPAAGRAPASVAEDRGPYPATVTGWPVVDAGFVNQVREDPAWCVIDARAPERYRGESEPIDPVAGHIPGAKNFYWQSQLTPEQRFRPSTELARELNAVTQGVPADRIICYCGSGVTACHVLLGLEASGKSGALLYPGSWSEWCLREELPR